jgi:hypothetical protein
MGISSPAIAATIRLGVKTAALLVSVALSLLIIVVAVPEGNDIAEVHVDKQARLRSLPSPKLVFIGGSNLMFGLDGERIEKELGVGVVNMGFNGFLGPRFLINEVRDSLHAGDVVVVSFEYEAYFEPTPYNSVEGNGPDHLILIKLRPPSAMYLGSWKQGIQVAKAVPQVALEKLRRLAEEQEQRFFGRPRLSEAKALMATIETRAAFNRHGDLTSYVGKEWPTSLYIPGPDVTTLPISEPTLELIRAFRRDMAARGVTVLLAPPPAPRDWFAANGGRVKQALRQASALGDGSPGLLGDPEEYVWPQEYFFDNANHLDSEGRRLRTARVIDHLRPAMQDRVTKVRRPETLSRWP